MKWTSLAIVAFCVAHLLPAQALSSAKDTAPLEVTLGYNATYTNGPPGGCGCFWMQGMKAEFSAPIFSRLSIAGELSGAHAVNINSAHEDLSLIAYLLGARYSLRTRAPIVPFAQALIGGVRGFNAIFPGPNGSTNAPDSFAAALGGGLNMNLSRRFAIRAIQADYLQTHLPNDGNNRQNSLRLSAGIVFRFGLPRSLE